MSEETQISVVTDAPTPQSDMMVLIGRMASDPASDIDKFERLVDLHERQLAKQAEAAFNVSMRACQSEMVPVVRMAENKHTGSKYAKLETIDNAIRPIYTKHGFSLTFNEGAKQGEDRVVMLDVLHDGGHSRSYQLGGALDMAGSGGKANKTAIQGLGSTVSYLRRYLTCMAFNVTLRNEDDDGHRAGLVFMNTAQVAELDALVKATGTDEMQFLSLMVSECRTFEEVDAKDFVRLKNALLSKQHKQLAGAKP